VLATNDESEKAMTNPQAVDRVAYPFTSRYQEIEGARMHYVDEGQGEVLLFVHGTPTWSFEWRHLLKAFAPHYRCIAPDQLGFGLSDRPRTADYGPEAHARRLRQFVAALNLQRFTLVVHDYGGPIGLPLALDRPEQIERLVVTNSWMWSFADDKEMTQKGSIAGSGLGRLLYRYLNFSLRVLTPYAYGDRKKLTPEIHKQYLDRFPDAWSRGTVLWALAQALNGAGPFYDTLWQRRERLQTIPALIIWGMADRAFEPRLLQRWRVALPSASIVELPGVGHWPHEEAPEQFIDAMRTFLQQQSAIILAKA
jgi:haloalkane dehalogenase